MFILPCLIGIGIGMEAGIIYYIYSVLIFIFMPIIPSAIVAIIVLLITSFTGLMRNKDLFMYVSMGLVLAFAFGYNYILQNVLVIDPNNIGSTLGSLEAEIIPLCKKIFPFYNSGFFFTLEKNKQNLFTNKNTRKNTCSR
jgi:ABC-2 type transport system permease protein